GVLSWYGLYSAHLHVALALVPIIPFLPVDQRETAHIFEADIHEHSTLTRFEHDWRIFIDFGLFFFGLSNAGVQFSEFGVPTWLVFCALLFGKTIGITLLGILARLMGFPLPNDMGLKELFTAGIVAAVGLTVALFMATAAFVDLNIQGAAKMGALLSALIAVIAVAFGRVLHIKRIE
ncbi:MAG: Na+/H+ antiporter NhaA, partial [Clostridia bacterium]|nr:Na+/H+ antiporter NhaA [Clostridia bacterium]